MERALAEYVVNALWQLPVLAAGAWVFIRLVRPGPQVQHGIWLAILALAVLLPARGLSKTSADQGHVTVAITEERTVVRERPVPFFSQSHDLNLNATASRWLVRIYLATVVLALVRIAKAWHTAHHMVASSRETCCHQGELDDLSQRFAVKTPRLRESHEVSSPMVVGVTAPVVLLPQGFGEFKDEEVRAALCHELAHIKRQDYLMNVVCQLAALPLAWHPVVHEIQQRIRMTREMVCDAMAAEEMKSHLGYAKCLVALANSMLGSRKIAGEAKFVGLFGRNTLEERVMRLMDETKMSVRARVARAATGAAMMIATGSLAAIFHVTPTMAEQAAAAPPQPANLAAGQNQPETVKPATPTTNQPIRSRHAAQHRKVVRQDEEIRKERDLVMLNDQEFQKRMEDAQRQMARANAIVDSPEFEQRMEDAQRQMARATEYFRSSEFRQQMENAQRQMATARVILDDPEFRARMEEAQRRMAKAAEVFRSPEFQQQIEEMRRNAEEAARDR
jgi:beta-lactamase regulating signal transducer with metallopeptidase domain